MTTPGPRFPLGSFGCLAAILGGGLAGLFTLLGWLAGLPIGGILRAVGLGFALLALAGLVVLAIDNRLHPEATQAAPASTSPYNVRADRFEGQVWIVWYEDQFSHDPSFATAFCFSEEQAHAAIKLAGGKMLEPGWDGYTISASTSGQVRWLFEHICPAQVEELERRIARKDYRAIVVPI